MRPRHRDYKPLSDELMAKLVERVKILEQAQAAIEAGGSINSGMDTVEDTIKFFHSIWEEIPQELKAMTGALIALYYSKNRPPEDRH